MPGPRRLFAAAVGAALVAAPLVVAGPAAADTTSVAVVGNLQDELGCPEDWQPDCADTELVPNPDGVTWSATFEVPQGAWEFKVALNDSWVENYGAGGVLDGANIRFALAAAARVIFTFDEQTHAVTFAPADLAGDTSSEDADLAKDSLRADLTRERFYFLMADRFANGRTQNDTGGLTGGPLTTGSDPTHKGFYHGGDLQGITEKLDYIKGLGTTAIWLTPSFKNKPVQGGPGQESAGYHGYWITDFTRIDPHLGTNADMTALIDAAHAKGMKVFFDIITNHTADVIDYEEKQYTYRSKKAYPYEDASGQPFDDRDFVGLPAEDWPTLDTGSFPYTPFLREGDENAKSPQWLNDPLMYHNRGDSTFAGESSTYGDFVGLDDLFTERPEVVGGMGDIYKTWVDFGIDGFRIDTVKHVNLEFWQQFVPDILAEAKKVENDDFFAFGEVYDGNPAVMSQYTTAGKLQATLDFGFQLQGVGYAKGGPATALADLFAGDDYYTDADSNAYQLPTFLGNHDMGRVAMFLKDASGGDEAEMLKRVKFANSLMFGLRGNPVTYYGDEQGFVSTGGDQLAREDMFASQVDQYNDELVLGGPDGSRDRYDTTAPLYQHIAALSALRAEHSALADGAQVPRFAADGPGVFAVSRIDADEQVEYVVAANNSEEVASATFPTWTKGKGRVFTPLFGTDKSVKPAANGSVKVTLPPLSVGVWRANKPVSTAGVPAPTVTTAPAGGDIVSGRAEVSAQVGSETFSEVTFYQRAVGTSDWSLLGTDDNAPFRVFHDVSDLPLGTLVEYRAVVRDAAGQVAADGTWAQVGTAPVADVDNGDPVPQPDAVSVPGTHNSEMGCPVELGVSGDWAPDCDEAQLALDTDDGIWKRHYTGLPAGPYSYKAALDRKWDVNYGLGGGPDNIPYETTDGDVSFYFDPATHWATSDEEGAIITVPGSFQKELGCPDDWQPGCMRPWLQDKDGDGIYTWSTLLIPADTWSFKVAHGLSWDESYPANDVSVTVPVDGAKTTFVYNSTTHEVTATSQ